MNEAQNLPVAPIASSSPLNVISLVKIVSNFLACAREWIRRDMERADYIERELNARKQEEILKRARHGIDLQLY